MLKQVFKQINFIRPSFEIKVCNIPFVKCLINSMSIYMLNSALLCPYLTKPLFCLTSAYEVYSSTLTRFRTHKLQLSWHYGASAGVGLNNNRFLGIAHRRAKIQRVCCMFLSMKFTISINCVSRQFVLIQIIVYLAACCIINFNADGIFLQQSWLFLEVINFVVCC